MLTLWSGILSNNASKVRIALAEKGLAYETREISWTRANQWGEKPEEFLKVSPRAQVPVLIDNGLPIHDSTVINEYLEEKYPEPSLFPKDITQKTMCRIWEDESDDQQKHIGVLITEVYLAEPGSKLSEAGTAAVSRLQNYLDRLNVQLGHKDYLCGDFSVADISAFLIVGFAQTMSVEVTQANVQKRFARMLERPSVKADFEAMMSAAATA